ncbi:MAG TPA: PAS domain-containing sensor histidine kinase [Patescibacteria group bacterium]|jgi:two-component system sensor histidine kinase VicK|nr:PAS domain-containing sensor histidine kinase [Patescibacteria group bacterium]
MDKTADSQKLIDDLATAKTLAELEKAKYEAMFTSIEDGLIVFDNNRIITLMNQAAENMLGRKSTVMIGKDVTNIVLQDEAGNNVPLNKRPSRITLDSGKTAIATSYYLVRKDKTRFPVALRVTPIKLSGAVIGAIGIFRDITQQKEIDIAKSEFMSLASHQLRTPLGIAKWYLEALSYQPHFEKMPKISREYFDEVRRCNERALKLVGGLLSISHIDQGRIKDEPKPTNVAQLTSDVIKDLRVLALNKKIKLKLEVKDQEPTMIYIDPLRLHEVIENLIANAIDYNILSGTVRVLVSQGPGKTLSISVSDTGIGMSKKEQELVFTKFFRTEKGAKTNISGTGLGLYLVKCYVELWGGTVTVKSSEGEGSTFVIILPLKPKNFGGSES